MIEEKRVGNDQEVEPSRKYDTQGARIREKPNPTLAQNEMSKEKGNPPKLQDLLRDQTRKNLNMLIEERILDNRYGSLYVRSLDYWQNDMYIPRE